MAAPAASCTRCSIPAACMPDGFSILECHLHAAPCCLHPHCLLPCVKHVRHKQSLPQLSLGTAPCCGTGKTRAAISCMLHHPLLLSFRQHRPVQACSCALMHATSTPLHTAVSCMLRKLFQLCCKADLPSSKMHTSTHCSTGTSQTSSPDCRWAGQSLPVIGSAHSLPPCFRQASPASDAAPKWPHLETGHLAACVLAQVLRKGCRVLRRFAEHHCSCHNLAVLLIRGAKGYCLCHVRMGQQHAVHLQAWAYMLAAGSPSSR